MQAEEIILENPTVSTEIYFCDYQKNSTKEYLYYVNGSEWMIDPDFRKAHAGQWEEIRPVQSKSEE